LEDIFRCVDVVMELFAMAASVSHARRLLDQGAPEAEGAVELADLFCHSSRRKVERLFQDLWSNEDARKNEIAASVLEGRHQWLAEEVVDLGLAPEAFQTRYVARERMAASG
jgi:hypothetical protein